MTIVYTLSYYQVEKNYRLGLSVTITGASRILILVVVTIALGLIFIVA